MIMHTFRERILALILALAFALMFTSAGTAPPDQGTGTAPVSQHDAVREIFLLGRGLCPEELIPPEAQRLTRPDTSHRPGQRSSLDRALGRGTFLLMAAVLVYLVMLRISRRVLPAKRYIIKYIHDQDGYKNRPSLYCITDQ